MPQPEDGHELVGGTDRRELLTRAFLATSFGAAAAGFGAAEAANAQAPRRRRRRRRRRKTVSFDVACRGNTFRMSVADGANPAGGDLYASPFLVEGYIYPKGTIPAGDGFDINSEPFTGHWFCNSLFMISPRRGQPHLIGHQQYVFGRIGPRNLFPRDQMVSHGMEGSDAPETFLRALTGGTGEYASARGVVLQTPIGTNNTRIEQLDVPAPNFRFKIELR